MQKEAITFTVTRCEKQCLLHFNTHYIKRVKIYQSYFLFITYIDVNYS